jgi:hypothetical protein
MEKDYNKIDFLYSNFTKKCFLQQNLIFKKYFF